MRAGPDKGRDVRAGTEHEERFRRVYDSHFDSLLTYALRRVEQPADAADVVAETFLIAWRRDRELPAGDAAKLWLYGVARKVLANHHRGGVRRQQLGERMRQRLRVATAPDPGHEVPERLTVRAALAQLAEIDREVLMLTFWEGLEPRETAEVLGISATVARARLSRARARFRDLMAPAGQVLGMKEGK
ncbi:RNA polymerase sigma-70 factor, ECF subfamily [Paractinoplanes atraurantiacus]|uniref:RNA polymerase sigma-70 factor, ECF subfamily n=1 Tax=Paractinoplanes atraurantiacus TaxID=1036182 RepID=A0A285JKX2_9ACTN|nr:RNA polymerase sigma-70 factor, ECF subfamily [Actinoplanes atraurantiacus]